MFTTKRASLPVLFILLGVLACALPAVPVIDQSAGATSVAETVNAIIQQTQDAGNDVVVLASDTPTLVPSSTFTLEPPTFTPPPAFTLPPTFTPTFTLTPTPLFTATPLVPLISVSVPTNCRVGPGRVYDQVGALLVGQTAQVYARDPNGNYWYIRNPDRPNGFCWVWGEYATVTGPYFSLPVFTPPPSPTPTMTSTPAPGFTASYDGLESCSAAWWVDMQLRNTGSISFESINFTVRDTATSGTITSVANDFVNKNGCDSTQKSILPAGKGAVVSSPQFSYDPNGHKLKITITLCSDPGLNGICVTQTFTVTP
ncbi:MAG: hypothetical protein ACM3MF_09960 [Anaerolineae bacterium]